MGLLSKIAKKKFKKKPKSLVSRFPKKRKSGGLFGSVIRKILEERQQIQPISIGNIIENELPRRGGFLKRIARRNIPNFIAKAREIDQDSISPLQNSIEKLRNSENPQLIEKIEVKPVEFDPITSIGKGIKFPFNMPNDEKMPSGNYDSIGMPLIDRRNMPEGVRGGRRRRFNEGGVAYTQAITYGPGGQMYTDGSRQTPYNPPQNMNTQTRNTDFGPVTISSPGGFSGQQQMPKMEQHIARPINDNMRMDIRDRRARPPVQDMMFRGQATGFDGNPIRNFGPQRGIGSFPNPFGGFMGGGRGNFMRPQPPMYGGGFGGFGMQPPMFGGGMGYGMPPMFGGGMYGGGFGMQPPMFGGGYGGGFGSPFGQSFYGGIGGMFPGMGGGYGMRPPSYGGFGGGYNRPMPQPMPQPMPPVRPQPMPPVRPQPMPRPVRPSIDSLRPARPIQMLRQETKGPGNLMRQRGGPIPLANQQMNYPF